MRLEAACRDGARNGWKITGWCRNKPHAPVKDDACDASRFDSRRPAHVHSRGVAESACHGSATEKPLGATLGPIINHVEYTLETRGNATLAEWVPHAVPHHLVNDDVTI